MSNSTIKINPSKPCELEFEVTIQGLEDSTQPTVRFVMSCSQGFDCSFVCDKGEDGKWIAKMPALPFLKDNSLKFRVEVIVDGYYFEPAEGVVYMVTDPSVKFQPNVSKPTVTTSFTVKQTVAEELQVGEPSPTNALLTPEFEPDEDDIDLTQETPDAEISDITDDISHVTPGETTDPDILDSVKDREFSPKRMAEAIVKNTLKGVQRPDVQGTLFKRDGEGKPVVNGLDSPAKKAQKIEKAARVREILGTK